MPVLTPDQLKRYRAETFCMTAQGRIYSAQQAVEFVNQRGFVFFWPIKDITFPSLWVAAAGDRPVADAHDDPGHKTWGWKDSLLPKKVWFYTRLLRKRNTIISLQSIPYFYALSPNFGSPEEDYLIEYEEGRMPLETRQVYEALLKEGPLDTLALRRAAHLQSSSSNTAFNRALESLQVSLRILPVGVSEAGAWHYAFIYDLVHRHFPNLIDEAGPISEYEARRCLLMQYFQSVGAATAAMATKLFGWRAEDVTRALEKLKQAGRLVDAVEIPGEKHAHWALPELIRG
ncbi:MAG TPA: crosslink repair DNA glycosylase YcaQ family protein [Anaerolineaceae bacterium]